MNKNGTSVSLAGRCSTLPNPVPGTNLTVALCQACRYLHAWPRHNVHKRLVYLHVRAIDTVSRVIDVSLHLKLYFHVTIYSNCMEAQIKEVPPTPSCILIQSL